MRALLVKTDAMAGGVARTATTLGQCALVVLGVHLAADNLDDRVLAGLTGATALLDAHLAAPLGTLAGWLGRPSDTLLAWDALPLHVVAAWVALLVEAAASVLLAGAFLLTSRSGVPTWPRYKRALSVQAVVMPVVLAGVLLAGAWSLAMGLEDVLPASHVAPWVAAMVGAAALARFGWPAWSRAVAALEPPDRVTRGLASAVVLLPVGLLAWLHGVPLWGWL